MSPQESLGSQDRRNFCPSGNYNDGHAFLLLNCSFFTELRLFLLRVGDEESVHVSLH